MFGLKKGAGNSLSQRQKYEHLYVNSTLLFLIIMLIFFFRCFSHGAVNNKAQTPFVSSDIIIICWGSLTFSLAADLLSSFTP